MNQKVFFLILNGIIVHSGPSLSQVVERASKLVGIEISYQAVYAGLNGSEQSVYTKTSFENVPMTVTFQMLIL